jgi:hypothetical protein
MNGSDRIGSREPYIMNIYLQISRVIIKIIGGTRLRSG